MVFGPPHLALLYIGRTKPLALYMIGLSCSIYIGEVEVLKLFSFFYSCWPRRQNYFRLYSLPYICSRRKYVGLSFTTFLLYGIIIMGWKTLSFIYKSSGKARRSAVYIRPDLRYDIIRGVLLKKIKLVHFHFSPLIYRTKSTCFPF